MNKDKLSEKLGEVFGEKKVKAVMPKNFLVKLTEVLSSQNKILAENLNNTKQFDALIEENKKTRELFIALKNAIEQKKIEKVEVINLPKPQEIRFPEQKEVKIPEFPKEIAIKKPVWYEKFMPDPILSIIEKGFLLIKKSFAEDLDRHKELENALAVRLVDSTGQTFYNAVFSSSGGGGGGDATAANQTTMIGLLTTIDADTGNIATDVSTIQTTLAAINSKLVTGTDIGDVTINNAAGASAVNIQDGGNTITVDGTVAVTNSDITSIKTAVEIIDNMISGSEAQVDIVASLPAGTNAIGNVGMTPRTSGGLLIKNCTSGDGSTALTNSAQAIKASAGQLFGWYIFNPNTVTAWVIIYNTAAASVTVGTTNPVLVIGVPAGAAANVVNPMGIEFTNAGWSAAAVMTDAAGNTAPTVALDANFFYI